jgi:Protein of unknown function (DUF3467)
VPHSQYANYFAVGFNAEEFVIEFGQEYLDEEPAGSHTRVVTGPRYAKQFAALLTDAVAQFERAFGSVVDGRPVDRRIKMSNGSSYGSGWPPTSGSAFDFGSVFSDVKKWLVNNDDKIVQVVLPWIKKKLGAGLSDNLPLNTPISAMVLPSQKAMLSPAVQRLTKGDLLALGAWGMARKLPQDLGLTAKDIQTIRDVFTRRLAGGASLDEEPEAWSLSCCSCTPCCCAAAVTEPSRRVA